MLPYDHKRTQQVQVWNILKLTGVCILLVFLWTQYTILTAEFGGTPVLVREPMIRNAHAHVRGNESVTETNNNKQNDATEVASGEKGVDNNLGPDKTYTTVSPEQEARRLAVRKAMKFAWGNYEKYSFGEDELDPTNGVKRNNVWGNIACSLVDGIDTLWIMDMKDEFQRARDYIATKLDFSHLGRDDKDISIFETVIREVGGLLSAFDLSGDIVFKQKAKELVDLLLPAYNETEGVFYTMFNPYTKEKHFQYWAGNRAILADIGTLQLEMRYLSDITDDPKYAKMGDAFYHIVKREGSFNETGLFPVYYDSHLGKFANTSAHLTLGGLGDSFYEYLLKVFIYSGQREEDKYIRELYDDVVKGMEEHLMFFSEVDDLYFLQEIRLPEFQAVQRMDHFVCFIPGLLALGTLSGEDHAKNAKHLDLAEKLMETCYQFYHRQPTGLSPDAVTYPNMRVADYKYRLRPEAIESLFYLYRVTANPKYREYGWEIFQSMEAHAKAKYGYGAVMDVTELPAQTENKMESFFFAETLKYHYLLQAPESLIPLDKYVFNTEAHPFSIR